MPFLLASAGCRYLHQRGTRRLRPGSGDSTRLRDIVVRAQVSFGHPRGRVRLCAARGQRGITLAQHFIVDQLLQSARERILVVGRNEQCGAVPEFTQAIDVAKHERTARQCRIEYAKTVRLVTRRGRVDRRMRQPAAPLRIAELTKRTHIVNDRSGGVLVT